MTQSDLKTATFAAGCFWGVQSYFDEIPGVVETKVGYTGGHVDNPNYDLVCTNTTGHAEAVEIKFDPKKISYLNLVKEFFKCHNPTTLNRQGPDIGFQYRSAIFYHDLEQKKIAEEYRHKLEKSGKLGSRLIVTEIVKAEKFWPAEEYHQKYFAKKGMEAAACHVAYPDQVV